MTVYVSQREVEELTLDIAVRTITENAGESDIDEILDQILNDRGEQVFIDFANNNDIKTEKAISTEDILTALEFTPANDKLSIIRKIWETL